VHVRPLILRFDQAKHKFHFMKAPSIPERHATALFAIAQARFFQPGKETETDLARNKKGGPKTAFSNSKQSRLFSSGCLGNGFFRYL
ncbi:hypothetical protein NY609_17165, partial [Enterobacter hormaechei]